MIAALGMLFFIIILYAIVLIKLNGGTDEQINIMENEYKNKLQENIASIQRTVYNEYMSTQSKNFEFRPVGDLNDKSN